MSKNLLAGLVSSAWLAVVSLAVIPQYLIYLGTEAYGLIGFFVTTQALFQLLDMGIAPTVNREVARCSISNRMNEARTLLHTLAIVYWTMAAMIAISIYILAPFISEFWLNSKQFNQKDIFLIVVLMGVVIACRWPIGLYQGVIIGAQRLVVSSTINIVMVSLSSLGAVAVLIYISPTIKAFFIWQASIGLLYAIVMRWAAWRVIGRNGNSKFSLGALNSIWKFSMGMGGVAVFSVIFIQMDKVILSKILSLEAFGHYMLATVVVSGMYLLVTPVFNIIYPKFSAYIVSNKQEKLINLYRIGGRLLASTLFPIAMLLVLFSEDLVRAWTGNSIIAISVAPIMAVLAVGTALHGVMYFPFALQIANGETRLALKINIVLLLLFIPMISFFALRYGALGGAFSWLLLHLIYMIIGTWMTHNKFLVGHGRTWLFQDVGVPLLLTVIVGGLGYNFNENFLVGASIYLKFITGLVLVLTVILFSFSLFPQHLRKIISSYLKNL
jgi:O-antigen/teichoic acid export membrane protein